MSAQSLECSEVYEALVQDHSVMGADHLRLLRHYRHELNVRQTAWDRLEKETDAAILTGKASYTRN